MANRRRENPRPVDPEARERQIAELMAESRLAATGAKRLMVEALVTVAAELRAIGRKREDGTATADEVRSLPGLTADIARLIDRLGLSAELREGRNFTNLITKGIEDDLDV